jgi:pectin methylesterase-like acyl-CoA thioesterase
MRRYLSPALSVLPGGFEMKRLTVHIGLVFAAGLGLMLALLWLLSSPPTGLAVVYAAELHVCPSGCPYAAVQAAVDAASTGDVIKVAAGTYTGVTVRPRSNCDKSQGFKLFVHHVATVLDS